MTIRKAKEIALSVVNAVPRIRFVAIEEIEELSREYLRAIDDDYKTGRIHELEEEVSFLEGELRELGEASGHDPDSPACGVLDWVKIQMRRLAELEASQQWIPAVEGEVVAPGDYLVMNSVTGFKSSKFSARYMDGHWYCSGGRELEWSMTCSDGAKTSKVTHYMPLPAPPDESEKQS